MQYTRQKKILFNTKDKFHCWIFSGPRNPDKIKIARDFSNWILEKKSSLQDLLVIDKEIIKTEDAKTIHKFASLAPACTSLKVMIINNLEVITKNAANSLLKLLEEPSPWLKTIIITDNLHKVIPTIRSRCFILRFPGWYNNNLFLESKNFAKKYEDILLLLSGKKVLSENFEDIEQIMLFALARIVKFHNNLITKQMFAGEAEYLSQLSTNKVFWHQKYKIAADCLKNKSKLSSRYILNAI